MTSPTPSQNGFPKTNGSLYSDLSLGRELADKHRAKRRTGSDSCERRTGSESCLTDFNRSQDIKDNNNGDQEDSLHDVMSHPSISTHSSISRQASISSDPFLPMSSSLHLHPLIHLQTGLHLQRSL